MFCPKTSSFPISPTTPISSKESIIKPAIPSPDIFHRNLKARLQNRTKGQNTTKKTRQEKINKTKMTTPSSLSMYPFAADPSKPIELRELEYNTMCCQIENDAIAYQAHINDHHRQQQKQDTRLSTTQPTMTTTTITTTASNQKLQRQYAQQIHNITLTVQSMVKQSFVSLFTTLLSLFYMSGNSLQIFNLLFVFATIKGPIQNMWTWRTTFAYHDQQLVKNVSYIQSLNNNSNNNNNNNASTSNNKNNNNTLNNIITTPPNPRTTLLKFKIIYFTVQCIAFLACMYKLYKMGLLPLFDVLYYKVIAVSSSLDIPNRGGSATTEYLRLVMEDNNNNNNSFISSLSPLLQAFMGLFQTETYQYYYHYYNSRNMPFCVVSGPI